MEPLTAPRCGKGVSLPRSQLCVSLAKLPFIGVAPVPGVPFGHRCSSGCTHWPQDELSWSICTNWKNLVMVAVLRAGLGFPHGLDRKELRGISKQNQVQLLVLGVVVGPGHLRGLSRTRQHHFQGCSPVELLLLLRYPPASTFHSKPSRC